MLIDYKKIVGEKDVLIHKNQKLAFENDQLGKAIYDFGDHTQKQQRKYDELHESATLRLTVTKELEEARADLKGKDSHISMLTGAVSHGANPKNVGSKGGIKKPMGYGGALGL